MQHDLNSQGNPTPTRPRRALVSYSPQRFRHPHDLRATQMVRALAGLEDLVRYYIAEGHDRLARLENVASRIRVGRQQLPDLYALFQESLQRMGLAPTTELYLGHGFNAWTSGVDQPYVVLGAELYESLTPEELLFVFGHELGHVRCRHVLYLQLAEWGARLAMSVPEIGRWFVGSLRRALMSWRRVAEFSADRAGLLVCQDFQVAGTCLMKLAGLPPALGRQINLYACLQQAEHFDVITEDAVMGQLRVEAEAELDHPWPILRLAQLRHWEREGEYESLLTDVGTAADGALIRPQEAPSLPAPAIEVASDDEIVFQPSVTDTPLQRLASALANTGWLSDSPSLLEALRVAAERTDEQRCTVAFVGEAGRGKTTWVNRLLGRPHLPVGRDGHKECVRLRYGAEWKQPEDSNGVVGEMNSNAAGESRAVELVAAAPLELLRDVDWLDLPGVASGDAALEATVWRAIYVADVVVYCVSALQLFSANERQRLSDQVVALTQAPVIIAVSHADEVTADADWSELTHRLTAILKPLPPERVLGVITARGAAHEAREKFATWLQAIVQGDWRAARRRQSLDLLTKLTALETWPSENEVAPAAAAAPEAPWEGQLRDEQVLALGAAKSHLRAGIAALRNRLAARFELGTPDDWEDEGVVQLTAETESMARDAARVFLESLQQGLADASQESARETSRRLDPRAASATSVQISSPDVEAIVRRPRDQLVLNTAKVGSFLLERASTWHFAVGGVAALAIADQLRRVRDAAFTRRARLELLDAAHAWLTATEATLCEQLNNHAESFVATIRAELLRLHPVTNPLPAAPSAAETIRTLWAEAQAWLLQVPQAPSATLESSS